MVHRHAPLGILAIVAIVGIAVLLYSEFLQPEVIPYAVQYIPAPQQPSQPNTFIIPNLDVGDFLGQDYPVISGDIIPALRPRTVAGGETRADVFQTVELRNTAPGGFAGGQIKFARTDLTNTVSDFIEYQDVIFGLILDFSTGLQSKIEGGEAPDLEGLELPILGDDYSVASVDVSGTRVRMRLFGGFGSVDLEDADVTDDDFHQGVKVNQQSVDAIVKIKASISGSNINIYSITYRLLSNAVAGAEVQVIPLHCTREYLQYPTGMLSPNFDICYAGLSGPAVPSRAGISGNSVKFDPRGDEKYDLIFTNNRGQTYETPLADLEGGLHYGRGTRKLVFKEAAGPGAPNIDLEDYVVLMSKESVTGVTNVVQFKNIDANTAYFNDLATGSQRSATYDPGTGEGQLLVGDGTYKFVVNPGNMLAMDQTNNGAISGNEAKIILPGGTKIDLDPGLTLDVITPAQLFDEPMGDESTDVSIVSSGGNIDLVVPSPQTTLPGYTFKMISEGGGASSGLTKYGILFSLDEDHASELDLVVPGGYSRPVKGGAQGGVYVTLDRPRIMKPSQAPPAKCGNAIKEAGEYCDPPGSLCVGAQPFERGKCSEDCKTCKLTPRTVCGNQIKEEGEECDSADADCQPGFACRGCKCLPLPAPVCGNNLIDWTEDCEADVDCSPGMMCSQCRCIVQPVVEAPAPPEELNIFARFFRWLASLFGG